MVENIYELKNKILDHVEMETMNMARIDVKEVGELVDMVKDLAEAEAMCWKAEYYKSVVESMKQGASQGYGQGGGQGYGQGGGTGSSAGYGSGRSGYQRQGRQGYGQQGHQEAMEVLRTAIKTANPDERERIRNEVKSIIGAM